MRVALVHDWLTGMRGGEWCLMAFLALYPDADVYSLIHVRGVTTPIIDAAVHGTSYLQKIPGVRKYYRFLLPLYPSAIRGINLEGYDLVISLSHAVAKNVSVPMSSRHVCYCFTPMRYIWDQAEQYFGRLTPMLSPIGKKLQEWDVAGADRVTDFIAISSFVAARIRKIYGRHSDVIHPPVETGWLNSANNEAEALIGDVGERAFLCAGALVPYKRIDIVVETFRRLQEKVWIVGGGPQLSELRKRAPKNVRFFGRASDPALAGFMKRARALLFPGIEDFGMIPVEAMAAGLPVIGIDKGGLRDTVLGVRTWSKSPLAVEESTGVFISARHYGCVEALTSAVQFFSHHEHQFSDDRASRRAQLFSPTTFFERWREFARARGILEQGGTVDQEPRIIRGVVNGSGF